MEGRALSYYFTEFRKTQRASNGLKLEPSLVHYDGKNERVTPSGLCQARQSYEIALRIEIRDSFARGMKLNLSGFTLRRCMTLMEARFLLERRVQRAQTLLRDLRASLVEIARSTGFADQHHLARVFRRITGITPSTYRRSL